MLLQDLQGRLRYFTLQEVRFFPFHYPNAVALLFYGSLTHYRLYIIAWTGAAAFLVSRVAAGSAAGCAGAGRLYAGAGGGPHLERGHVQLLRRAAAGVVLGHDGLALPVCVGDTAPPLGCAGRGAVLYRLRHL